MLITLNVGGALIPLAVSAIMLNLLLLKPQALKVLLAVMLNIAVVTFSSYAFSRVVPGVGVVLPALLPPLTSALTSFIATLCLGVSRYMLPVAYIGAVTGTLVGADLLNLVKNLDKLRAHVVSIGGAGVFDGVYLSGVMALTLALLMG